MDAARQVTASVDQKTRSSRQPRLDPVVARQRRQPGGLLVTIKGAVRTGASRGSEPTSQPSAIHENPDRLASATQCISCLPSDCSSIDRQQFLSTHSRLPISSVVGGT